MSVKRLIPKNKKADQSEDLVRCEIHQGSITAFTALTAIPAPAAAFTGRTLFTGTCHIDGEGPALELLAVEHLDGVGRFFRGGELDKGEAARFAGELVEHHVDGTHDTGLAKVVLQIVFKRLEGKIANK